MLGKLKPAPYDSVHMQITAVQAYGRMNKRNVRQSCQIYRKLKRVTRE